MKIIVDDKIPFIREALAATGSDVAYLRGSDIGACDVADADALIVRTRTRCDAALLAGSRVSFVATATIGYDHLDTAFLDAAGIRWMNCPGCNSGSVAQYVESVLLVLSRYAGLDLGHSVLGVVGCGHVGSKVVGVARRLGMEVLVCDPPLGHADFVSLDEVARRADVITFHVPLDATTRHMADDRFFSQLVRRPVVINSSRGEVVDTDALLRALDRGLVSQAVVDTWEHEPLIDRRLLERAYLATPHIAGYSADGKANADNMILEGLCRHFALPLPPPVEPPELPSNFVYSGDALQLYDVRIDSRSLKCHPDCFEQLRGDYRLRRERPPRR